MPGPNKGYTTPHVCMTVNNPHRNQPSERDQRARQRLQQRASDFYAQFYGPVFLSIGPEVRRDIHDNFDPDKLISFHLDPPINKEASPGEDSSTRQ